MFQDVCFLPNFYLDFSEYFNKINELTRISILYL